MSEPKPRRVEVLQKQRVYTDFMSLDQAVVRYERFDGTLSEPVTRLVLDRGDAVGILLYDPEADQLALVEQFRYPVYAAGEPGWLVEIVAGTVPRGADPRAVASSEVREEAGYDVDPDALEPLGSCFLSPGGSSERVYLFLARVSLAQRQGELGGLRSEGEDTRLCLYPCVEARRLLQEGAFHDAKTLVALQAFFLRRKSR